MSRHLRSTRFSSLSSDPARIGRAGVAAPVHVQCELNWPLDSEAPATEERSPSPLRRNPILSWLQSKTMSMRSYLEHLAKMDTDLATALRETYALKQIRRRLALTLFIDFSHEQGLSAGEVATLIGDAQQAATDAVQFLIGAALNETRTCEPDQGR